MGLTVDGRMIRRTLLCTGPCPIIQSDTKGYDFYRELKPSTDHLVTNNKVTETRIHRCVSSPLSPLHFVFFFYCRQFVSILCF